MITKRLGGNIKFPSGYKLTNASEGAGNDREKLVMNEKIIKVQHIITSLSRGGAETMLYKLIESLPCDSGFKHSVISLTGENAFDFASMGVPVKNLEMQRGIPSVKAWKLLRQHVRAFTPDLIQGWMYHGNFAASIAANSRKPVFFGMHYTLSRFKEEKRVLKALIYIGAYMARGSVSRVVYCSQKSRRQHEAIGYPAAKSVFIPNGYDCERFRPAEKGKNNARAAAGLVLPEDALVAGHAARYHPMKNHLGIIRSFSDVVKRQSRAHLVMIGRDVTPENAALQKAVSMAGLRGRVHLLGERNDMARMMSAFDVYLSGSSWGEAFPIVLGEAMSCGVPCIATDVGDSSLLIGDTGRIVQPGDEAALAASILEILSMSEEDRLALGNAARNRVVSEFSLPATAGRYAELYRELSGRC